MERCGGTQISPLGLMCFCLGLFVVFKCCLLSICAFNNINTNNQRALCCMRVCVSARLLV